MTYATRVAAAMGDSALVAWRRRMPSLDRSHRSGRRSMKPYRSMLFVPGHKPTWADKAVATGSDALILDLEDSVPPDDKADGRKAARGTIERLRTAAVRPDVWVRPNSADSGLMGADLEDVVVPGLRGLFLPKVVTAREIVGIDAVLAHLEQREGLTLGSVELIVTFETAVA